MNNISSIIATVGLVIGISQFFYSQYLKRISSFAEESIKKAYYPTEKDFLLLFKTKFTAINKEEKVRQIKKLLNTINEDNLNIYFQDLIIVYLEEIAHNHDNMSLRKLNSHLHSLCDYHWNEYNKYRFASGSRKRSFKYRIHCKQYISLYHRILISSVHYMYVFIIFSSALTLIITINLILNWLIK